MRPLFVIIMGMILWASFAQAKNLHKEKWYQEKWCLDQGGQVEVVLSDKTRCDCFTNDHAIEFDFGYKWAEAIGQSLHYSLKTGKKAGVVLIIERPRDKKYWVRLNAIVQHYKLPIDTWILGPGINEDKNKSKKVK